MSENKIVLVPKDAMFLPHIENAQSAVAYFHRVARSVDEIIIQQSEGIQFFDCGTSFEQVRCPSCQNELLIEWWQDRMDEDYNNGFSLTAYDVPCCKSKHNLNQLIYEWPQAFGRFGIAAINPDIGRLRIEEVTRFQEILRADLSVIYHCI